MKCRFTHFNGQARRFGPIQSGGGVTKRNTEAAVCCVYVRKAFIYGLNRVRFFSILLILLILLIGGHPAFKAGALDKIVRKETTP